MKVVLISNYFTHHQSSICEELHRLTNGGFIFVETEIMEKERVDLGWNITHQPKYIIKAYECNTQQIVEKLINEADVVIIGSAPDKFIKKRLKEKKLIFRYSERIFKKKFRWYKWPIWCIKFYLAHIRHENLYLLTASAYASADYAKMFSFIKKSYKWGYFPEVKKHENIDGLIEEKNKNSIVWVARLIDWKHPEIAIKLAERLKKDGYDFELKMIGNGTLLANVSKEVEECGLTDCVNILGAMSPEEVRSHMEKSEIHIFTSDRNEGWGAVLNESMNSACVPVANHAIGSVPFLLKDGENGFIYKDGDFEDFYNKVKYLLDNPEKRIEMGKKAYQTMINEWNAENAAKKFIELCETYLKTGKMGTKFEKGVCSKAKILKDDWYNGK